MYGTATRLIYDWGREPAKGDPVKHWHYHQPIYEECRRVLRPGGILAWGQGFRFAPHFISWFGAHQVWSPLCYSHGLNFIPITWVVQTKERQPIGQPNNMLVHVDRKPFVYLESLLHPCPKPMEEMKFMIHALTKPGQIILGLLLRPGHYPPGGGNAWPSLDRLRFKQTVLPDCDEPISKMACRRRGCRRKQNRNFNLKLTLCLVSAFNKAR